MTLSRTWTVSAQPSNELKSVQNEVTRGWLCYSGHTGRLLNVCTVSFALLPSTDPLVINGVTNDCVYGANRSVDTLTCGHGGHIHDLLSRPVIYAGTKVRYFSDTDGNDLTVTDEPSSTGLFDGFRWTVPHIGGYYKFESTMLPAVGRKFVTFGNGVLQFWDAIKADGIAEVKFPDLRQLPDDGILYYDKGRNGDQWHTDDDSYSAQERAVWALRAIGRTYKNNTGSLISYNDISLPLGGIFEVRPDLFPWEKGFGHSSHREGLDIDVNKPGGQRCDNYFAVQTAVDTILRDNPLNPDPNSSSALLCETASSGFPSDPGNYHIDITTMKRPSGYVTPIVIP
ncbi:MAG: hypothetical protein OEY04_07590 [Gammaproteobacteria bacterium]|nr:hypothetical protein [Gammaproteobacteria bacterium]